MQIDFTAIDCQPRVDGCVVVFVLGQLIVRRGIGEGEEGRRRSGLKPNNTLIVALVCSPPLPALPSDGRRPGQGLLADFCAGADGRRRLVVHPERHFPSQPSQCVSTRSKLAHAGRHDAPALPACQALSTEPREARCFSLSAPCCRRPLLRTS